jgi:uncharacterized membrane protein YkvI
MENLCLYKQKWILSYILGSIILIFIMQSIGIDKDIQSGFALLYLVVHTYIVIFYKTTECKKFKDEHKNDLLNISKPNSLEIKLESEPKNE